MASIRKIIKYVCLLLALAVSANAANLTAAQKATEAEFVPGEVVVKANQPDSFAIQLMSGENSNRISDVERFADNHFRIKLNSESDTTAMLTELNSNAMVDVAEPNYIYRISQVIPDDRKFNELWGLHNTGSNGGVAGADIAATKAWQTHTGSKSILVAIIDTGVDYTHEDLRDNIYTNPNEIAGNGIDDDGNGFVDDVRGWNFAGVSTNDPMDDNMHGTHVAGTIGAKGNNRIGVAGVNWKVSIVPIKFLTGRGSGTLVDAIKSIDYATKLGVHVMNNSWGGGGFSQTLKDAVVRAEAKGILFVAAAGNSSSNNDSRPMYPAAYQVPNVLSVAASDHREKLAVFSNFGKRTVHLAAPGSGIMSTVPGNGYRSLSGTSMASPHVAGAAALVLSAHPNLTYAELKERLIKSTDQILRYQRTIKHSGRLNVYNAVNGIFPAPIDIPEDAWQTSELRQVIETSHPYASNSKETFEVEGPNGASKIRLLFDRFETEKRYDTVKIYDRAGKLLETLSGDLGTNGSSWHIDGNYARIEFKSDSSVNKWGFKLSKIQYITQ